MSILKIITYGHSTLRKKAVDVETINDELKDLVEDMFETMEEAEGIGLAAPQVNKSIRLITIAMHHIDEEMEPMVFINPEIINYSDETEPMEEGCLSIPGIREEVIRPTKITVKFTTLDGEEETWDVEGLLAKVFQHEIDHLNGDMFTDKISPLKKQLIQDQLDNLTKIA